MTSIRNIRPGWSFQDPRMPLGHGQLERPQPNTDPVLPSARLTRLGATTYALNVYRAWWDNLDGTGEKVAATQLSILNDAELTAQIDGIETLADAGVRGVVAWARDDTLRAGLAIAAEGLRDEPRQSVFGKLR